MGNRKTAASSEESVENCPLFTDIPVSKVRSIEVNGVRNGPTGQIHKYIDSIAPIATKNDIRAEFGGGTFLIRALGEGQQPLEEAHVDIAGRVLWDQEEDEEEEEEEEQFQPSFGARFAGRERERERGNQRDPRRDPYGDRGYDPRRDPYGDRGYGSPYGPPPWAPRQQQQGSSLQDKLLEAFIARPAVDATQLQSQLESLRLENERLRSQCSSYQSEIMEIRRKYNQEIDDERQRGNKFVREFEEKLDRLRDELSKERSQRTAHERRIFEMELLSKYSKDGKSEGFSPDKLGPLMPIIGVMVSKWLGLSPAEMDQLAAEQNQMQGGGASAIPGIPSE